jgi:hypothetical protein
MQSRGIAMSSKSLSEVFSEGEKAMRQPLKELRDLGIIVSSKERIGNRIMTINRLVDASLWTPETGALLQQYQLNSYLIINTNLTNIQIKNLSDQKVGWEGQAEMENYEDSSLWMDADDLAKARDKAYRKKHEEKLARKKAKTEEQLRDLQSRTPDTWTIKNAVYEFKTRLVRWDVSPWEGSTEPFSIAFANARNEYGTKGIEDKMIDRFFMRYDNDTALKDPQLLWKLFIRDFGTLAKEVRQSEEAVTNFASIKAEARERFRR